MFKVYAGIDLRLPPSQVGVAAQRIEALGFDGMNVPDGVHDGLLTATLALNATKKINVATSVLVAFPRSPMTVAQACWDLQALSAGRFELGLGTQIKQNIEDRYSAVWQKPLTQMREYVLSLRAIFNSFETAAPLKFEGEFYHFKRLQPFFNPGPFASSGKGSKSPPIYLGAVGDKMIALAAEVGDGLILDGDRQGDRRAGGRRDRDRGRPHGHDRDPHHADRAGAAGGQVLRDLHQHGEHGQLVRSGLPPGIQRPDQFQRAAATAVAHGAGCDVLHAVQPGHSVHPEPEPVGAAGQDRSLDWA